MNSLLRRRRASVINRCHLWPDIGENACMPMKTNRRNTCCIWIGISLLLTASGCHRYLVDTPNLLHQQDPKKVYAACPAECQSPEAPVIYATDRAVVAHKDRYPVYGSGRSN